MDCVNNFTLNKLCWTILIPDILNVNYAEYRLNKNKWLKLYKVVDKSQFMYHLIQRVTIHIWIMLHNILMPTKSS